MIFCHCFDRDINSSKVKPVEIAHGWLESTGAWHSTGPTQSPTSPPLSSSSISTSWMFCQCFVKVSTGCLDKVKPVEIHMVGTIPTGARRSHPESDILGPSPPSPLYQPLLLPSNPHSLTYSVPAITIGNPFSPHDLKISGFLQSCNCGVLSMLTFIPQSTFCKQLVVFYFMITLFQSPEQRSKHIFQLISN